jgi:hypothetical protein
LINDEIERTYEKDLDYATVYADNVILEFGEEMCRLIFYQEGLDLTENREAFDKSKKSVHLKFEVRIPHIAAVKLAINAKRLFDIWSRAQHYEVKDEEVQKALARFNKRIESLLYDTRESMLESREVDKLRDDFEELIGRLRRQDG